MTTAYKRALSIVGTLPPVAQISLREDSSTVEKVLAFHHLYEAPIQPFGSTDPQFQHMPNERVAVRLGFLLEEVKELFEKGFGVTLSMQFHTQTGYVFREESLLDALGEAETYHQRDGAEIMDALGDIDYVDTGFAIEMGFDPRPVMAEIHGGNMTKLGDDGKPITNGVTPGYTENGQDGLHEPGYRSDLPVGKVIKGPHYFAPRIDYVLGFIDEEQ